LATTRSKAGKYGTIGADVKNLLIILSGVVTIVAAVPYLIEIIRGKAKPRIVSWFTWSLLTGIGCAAAFAEGQVASGVLLLCATIEVLLIAVLGFKHGDRKFERFDIVCQIAALAGLLLWFIFNSPAIAVVAAVAIDLVGALPTFKHSWLKSLTKKPGLPTCWPVLAAV
jgi:hypothetical protein